MDATTMQGVVAAVLLVAGAPPEVSRADEQQRVEADIKRVVRGIVEAVVAREVDALMAYVGPEGVPCIDSVVTKDQLRRDLTTRGNFLHAYYFDASEFNDKYRDLAFPKSLAEFLATTRDLRVKVSFMKYSGQGQADEFAYPCATLSAPQPKERHSFCFSRNQGKWTLADLPNCG